MHTKTFLGLGLLVGWLSACSDPLVNQHPTWYHEDYGEVSTEHPAYDRVFEQCYLAGKENVQADRQAGDGIGSYNRRLYSFILDCQRKAGWTLASLGGRPVGSSPVRASQRAETSRGDDIGEPIVEERPIDDVRLVDRLMREGGFPLPGYRPERLEDAEPVEE